MRPAAALLSLIFLLATGCGGPQTPAKAGPDKDQPAAKGDPAKPTPAKPDKPPATDVSAEVLGTLYVAAVDTVLDQGIVMVKPQLPPAFAAFADASTLKMRFFNMVRQETKLQNVDQILDTSRPAAAAMVDPKVNGGRNMQPILLAVPIKDPQALLDFLGRRAESHEVNRWKDHIFLRGSRTMRVRFADQYALIASSEKLLNGAAAVLMPLVNQPPKHMARMRIDMATLYQRFQKEMDRGLAKAKREMARNSKDTGGIGVKMVGKWLDYITQVDDIFMELDLDGKNIRFNAGGTAQANSALAGKLGELNAGELWGVDYMPVDAAFVMGGRENPEMWTDSIDDAMKGLQTILEGVIDPKVISTWTDLAKQNAKHYTGETAGAMWATADGGLGLASVSKVKDGKAARQAMATWVKMLAKEVKRLQAKVFKKQIRKELPGMKVDIRFKKNALRAGKIKGDVVELSVRWPKMKNKVEKEQLDKAKKAFRALLGKKLQFGFAVVNDTAVMVMGKNFKKQAATIVGLVAGNKGTGMAAKMAPYVHGKKVMAAVYMPLESMVEQVMRVVSQVTPIEPKVKQMINQVMPPANVQVPAATVMHIDGNKAHWETNVSSNLVGMIARGVAYFVMQRGMGRP